MVAKAERLRIGKISGTHGTKGELILSHILPDAKWMKNGTALMISLRKDSFIPYFVEHFKPLSHHEILIALEDLNDMESAKKLRGKEVFVNSGLIKETTTHSPLAWIGFAVIDKRHGALGNLEDILQSGTQWLGKVNSNEKEILFPLIAEFLEKIEIDTKTIFTQLPEGLIEIYTG